MPKKYKSIQLSAATKVLRAHSTQIDPPGMLELKNIYIARSDNAISLRSDWQPAYAGMSSYSPDLAGSDLEDYLNTAFYVSRSGHIIWFGRWIPFTWENDNIGQLYTVYEEGTITTTGNGEEVVGTDTSWLDMVWPGCLIREKGAGETLYQIRLITNNKRLLTTDQMPVLTDAEYEILRVHPAVRADWPIRIESLGGYLVYGTVDMAQPIDEAYISGPFYSNIGRPDLGIWNVVDGAKTIPVDFYSIFSSYPKGPDVSFTNKFWTYKTTLIFGSKGAVFCRNFFDPIESYQISVRTYGLALDSGITDRIAYLSTQNADHQKSHLTRFDPSLEYPLGETLTSVRSRQETLYPDDSPQYGVSSYSDQFYAICYHRLYTKFACGPDGLLMGDAVVFTTGVTVDLRDICYGKKSAVSAGDHYVIVGDADDTDGVALYFTDPASISRGVTGTSESFTSVSYSNYHDRWVAVGTNGLCMTSDDDGATWTSRTIGPSITFNCVLWDFQGRCCCAVGQGVTANAYLSLDGITWEELDLSAIDNGSPLEEEFVDLAFERPSGTFVAVTKSGRVFAIHRRVRLKGGATYLGPMTVYRSDYICDLIHNGSLFVAVGKKIWTSPTGDTWTVRHEPATSEQFTSVAFDSDTPATMVAVGYGGIIYRSTDNGVNWSSITSGVTTSFIFVGYKEDVFVAGGDREIVRSLDYGASWGTVSYSGGTIKAMAVSETDLAVSGFYASAIDGKIYIGGSGNWSEYTYPRPQKAFLQDTRPRRFEPDGFPVYLAMAVNNYQVIGGYFIGASMFGTALDTQSLSSVESQQGAVKSSHIIPMTGEPFITYASWKHGRNSIVGIDIDTIYPTYVCLVDDRSNRLSTLTSTDGGATWDTPYPQDLEADYDYYPILENYQTPYMPICSDGTDFFFVVSQVGPGITPLFYKIVAEYEILSNVWEME